MVQYSAVSLKFLNFMLNHFLLPTTPSYNIRIFLYKIGLGCFYFARRYSKNHFCFLFLNLLRCFSSVSWLFPFYEFKRQYLRLPYSGIFVSKLVSSSTKHIIGNSCPSSPLSAQISIISLCTFYPYKNILVRSCKKKREYVWVPKHISRNACR